MPVHVDIVLPCYNPSENWSEGLLDFHQNAGTVFNINYILVNDGSDEKNILQQLQYLQSQGISLQYISYALNQGKGFALRKGVLASNAEYIVYTDIDFPFTNQSVLNLITCLVQQKADIATGYRNEGYYENSMSGFRIWLSKAFRFFIKQFLKMPISDTQCGLKGFNKKGKEKFLTTRINRYLFDFEFIYLSCRNTSINLVTVPVTLKPNVIFRSMKLKILIQESVNLLYVLLFRKA